jgi:hypothetical protein
MSRIENVYAPLLETKQPQLWTLVIEINSMAEQEIINTAYAMPPPREARQNNPIIIHTPFYQECQVFFANHNLIVVILDSSRTS